MTTERPRPHPLRRGGRSRPHHPITRARPSTPAAKASPGPLAALVRAAGLGIADAAIAATEAYLLRMLEENKKLNLTGIRDPEQAAVLHALDSLHLWNAVAFEPTSIVDIGSGNGFPGVVAACLWPNARTTLIERTGKKAAAIRRCLDEVGLEHVKTLAIDAVQLRKLHPELVAATDLVVSRATGTLAKITELAAPLLSRGQALLVHYKAAEIGAQERNEGMRAARRAKLTPREDYEYALPGDETRLRRLVCFTR